MSFFDDLKQWFGYTAEESVYTNVHDAGHSVVDYDISLINALAVANCSPDTDITEHNFPPNQEERGKREFTFSFFIFSTRVLSDEAIHEMKRQGYRPATLRELLAFNKEGNRGHDYLVALGSSCSPFGMKKAPCYCSYNNRNCIQLEPFNERWSSIYNFLAVSEKS